MTTPVSTTHGSLARSAGVIGSLTFLSRLLGFVRDVLTAHFFGTTLAAEAFVVSFKLPNLFRDIAGEGAVSSAVVPVLSEVRAAKGDAEFRRLYSSLIGWFVLILIAISAGGVLFAPAIVRFAAPGFSADPVKFALTVELTRLMFPFIFIIGMAAILMGILNTVKSFAASAFGPVLLNLSMIASFFVLEPRLGVKGLVIGVLAGGCLQLGLQIYEFIRRGLTYERAPLWNEGVRKIARLLVPRAWGTAVYQVSVFVDTIIASFYWIVGAGGQSALYYSSRLFQLPMALFGSSFAQAALPELAGYHARKEHDRFRQAASFSLRSIFFMTLPAAFGLAALSEPIIRILFKRGAFTEYSVGVTSQALFFYAFGLTSAAAAKLLANALYAMQDTRTPVKAATLALAANLGLNIALMWPLKIGGLALATSLSTTLNAASLYAALSRRLGGLDARALRATAFKAILSSAFMGITAFAVLKPWILASEGFLWASVAKLGISIGACVVLYFSLSYVLGSEEAKSLAAKLKRASNR